MECVVELPIAASGEPVADHVAGGHLPGCSAGVGREVVPGREPFDAAGASQDLGRVGLDVDQIPRRLAICDRMIHRDGPLVVGDATEYPCTVGTDMRAAGEQVRFYAGYPIESPDGRRLGALCVFDTAFRDPADVDEEQLRELALRVQNQLWAEYGPITTP